MLLENKAKIADRLAGDLQAIIREYFSLESEFKAWNEKAGS